MKNNLKPLLIILVVMIAIIILLVINESNPSASRKIDELESEIKALKWELDRRDKRIDTLKKTMEKSKTTPKPTTTIQTTPKNTPSPTKKPEPKEYTFGPGNYISGKDFEPGTYDVIAVKGNMGNVSSDNMYSGGINAIMGLSNDAVKEYKNIKFPDGVTLTISSVLGELKIKIVKK